jgi:hypothetical protein
MASRLTQKTAEAVPALAECRGTSIAKRRLPTSGTNRISACAKAAMQAFHSKDVNFASFSSYVRPTMTLFGKGLAHA